MVNMDYPFGKPSATVRGKFAYRRANTHASPPLIINSVATFLKAALYSAESTGTDERMPAIRTILRQIIVIWK